jgi:hypothetical protein
VEKTRTDHIVPDTDRGLEDNRSTTIEELRCTPTTPTIPVVRRTHLLQQCYVRSTVVSGAQVGVSIANQIACCDPPSS